MFDSDLAKIRTVVLAEGVSFLLLLFVAMPLKYMAGIAIAVKIAGWIHGALFLYLCWLLVQALTNDTLPFKRAVMVFIASLIPFGPFIINHKLRDAEAPQSSD